MPRKAAAITALGLSVVLGFFSCSSGPDACEQLAEACHHLGGTAGFGNECHELGHDGVVAECNRQLSACLSFCAMPADDGGADATEAGQD